MYTGSVSSGTATPVAGALNLPDLAEGSTLSTSGATTGEHGNLAVANEVSEPCPDNPTYTCSGGYQLYSQNQTTAAGGGDSGGPVFQWCCGHTKVKAVGMISDYIPTVPHGYPGQGGSSQVGCGGPTCYSWIIFYPIGPILDNFAAILNGS